MMYECHSDAYGMMPCDYGCMCDKCMHMDVKIVDESDGYCEDEEDED